jgi:hypothetical protein
MVLKIASWGLLAVVLILLAMVFREGGATIGRPWVDIAPSGQPPPSTPAGIPEPTTVVSPEVSAVVVHGLANAPMMGLLLSALALTAVHRRRARALRALDPRAPLRDGAAMIAGEVEWLPGDEGPVVSIRIEQHGTQQTSRNKNPSHTWTEVDREIRVKPFIVRCEDGSRVRVEPDDQVILEADLAVIVMDGRTTRARRAELDAGARVHITGELHGASGSTGREDVYRSKSGNPVLTPSRAHPMVISTRHPGAAEEQLARYHGDWALRFVFLVAVLAGALLPSYELLAFDGKIVMAEVTGTATWQEWVKSKSQPDRLVISHAVRARLPRPDGSFTSVEEECNQAIHECVSRRACAYLPFVVSAHVPSVHELGTRPTVDTARGVGLILFMLFFGGAYVIGTFAQRPWYREKKLIEGGDGPLTPKTP